MKVLFINTIDISGGAAIAMQRIIKSLKDNYKIDYKLLVSRKLSDDINTFEIRPIWQKKIESLINLITDKLGLQYIFFPFSKYHLLKIAKQYKPDIIHLHNIHGGFFQINILPELSEIAPIVYTLHDMWSFTGHEAYSYENNNWQYLKSCNLKDEYPAIGIDTSEWLLKQKLNTYKKSNITIVTPSFWLKNLASKSPLFKNKEIINIKYALDFNTFFKKFKNLRKKYNIPLDAKVLIFSAENINNPRKGSKYLFEILKQLNKNIKEKIHIILIGNGNVDKLFEFNNFIIYNEGYINSEHKLSELLSISDILLYTSLADNLPNTLIESITCGLPAITFDIGGCKEIIQDNKNGFAIKPFDIKDFVDKTILLLNNNDLRNKFSKNAQIYSKENYKPEIIANQYFKLYTKLHTEIL